MKTIMQNKNSLLIILFTLASFLVQAQGNNEFTIPLSDPGKRGKLKAHLNYGSITVNGTARKDVSVKYNSSKDEDSGHKRDREGDERRHEKRGDSKDGLRRIAGGGLELD